MSKYLSYKHRHTLRRFMAMVFAVMLALSPLQTIAMADASYFVPIESTSFEWEYISMEDATNNNEETATPSYNYPSETATDENNATETGTEEQPSTNNNNNEETPSTPPTGDGATDEPSSEENATEEPSGDAGFDTDTPSEDATDQPSDSDDATEPGSDEDDATEPGTEDATEEESTDEPTEEPTDLLGLLPILVPPVAFSGNATHWTVNFWADYVNGDLLGYFETPIEDGAVIIPPWGRVDPPTNIPSNFIGWNNPETDTLFDLDTMEVQGDMNLVAYFVTTGVLHFLNASGSEIIATHMVDTADGIVPPNNIEAEIPLGQSVQYWYNEDDATQRFFVYGEPNPPVVGIITLRPRFSMQVVVNFNLHGGVMAGQPTQLMVWPNTVISQPSPAPTRHGWQFKHWSDTQIPQGGTYADTTPFDFSQPIAINTTLHAIWYDFEELPVGFTLALWFAGPTGQSWQLAHSLAIDYDEFPHFGLVEGSWIEDDGVIIEIAQRFNRNHPRVTHASLNRTEFTMEVGTAHVRQSAPLNAEGSAMVNIFHRALPFDVFFDMSQEVDGVVLASGANTFTNTSAERHSIEIYANMWTGSGVFMNGWPRDVAIATSGQTTISRPGYVITGWQWTDGAFLNERNAAGNWQIAHGRSGTFGISGGAAVVPLDPNVRQAIIVRPVWATLDGRVMQHNVSLINIHFDDYRSMFHNVNPTNRNLFNIADLLDTDIVPFETQYNMLRSNARIIRNPSGPGTLPYFRTHGNAFIVSNMIPRESIDDNGFLVWNSDQTAVIRYQFAATGNRAIALNPAPGHFDSSFAGFNNNTGMVNITGARAMWPYALTHTSPPTARTLPDPIPELGYVFLGWRVNAALTQEFLAPAVNSVTGYFLNNGTIESGNNSGTRTLFAEFEAFPPEFTITDGRGNAIHTRQPNIVAGDSLEMRGYTLDDLLPPGHPFVRGNYVPGRGTFSTWGVSNGTRTWLFSEGEPMSAGLFMLFPVFDIGHNTITFHDFDGNPVDTRTVLQDIGNEFDNNMGMNSIIRTGNQRWMPPIPNGQVAGLDRRFVWTTAPNGGGDIFTQHTLVTENINVYPFFDPFVTISFSVRDWGNGETGNSATLPLNQRVVSRFGVVNSATVAAASDSWQFGGWFNEANTRVTDSLTWQPVQDDNNNFVTQNYEARFRAVLNFQADALGRVDGNTSQILFPNETPTAVTAVATNPSTTNFSHWTNQVGDTVGTVGNPVLQLTGTMLPNTFTANFNEFGQAQIDFVVAQTLDNGINATGGLVSPTVAFVDRNAAAAPSSGVLEAFASFEFVGWSLDNNPDNLISTNRTEFVPPTLAAGYWDNNIVHVFYAHFREVDVTHNAIINFQVAEAGRGTVSHASRSLRPVSGDASAATSTATAEPGFVFEGWALAADGGIIDTNATRTPARQDMGAGPNVFTTRTYFARFVEDEGSVTITYRVNDARGGSVTPGSETGVNPLSSRDDLTGSIPIANSGWRFNRWAQNANGTGAINSDWWDSDGHLRPHPLVPAGSTIPNAIPVFQDRVFYAIFDLLQFTIGYNLNSGTHTGNPEAFNVTMPDIILSDASRDGHAFLGWYTTNDFAPGSILPRSTDINNPGSILNTSPSTPDHVTLWARWQANPHTVTFESTGHNADGTPPSTINTHWGANINVPATPVGFTRDGHTFGGWRLNDTTTILQANDPIPTITSDVTLTAVWNINRFTVTYTNNLAVGTVAPHNNVDWNTNVTVRSAETLTREGHNFVNWLIEGTINTINPNEPLLVTEDITLVAQWQIRQYRVTLESGTGEGAAIQQPLQNWGTTIVLPEVPLAFSKEGHHFIGWRLDGNAANTNPGNAGPITGNRTATAQWAINSHTLTYVGNGHTGGDVPTPEDFNWNELVTVAPQGNLARDGHTFLGWATTANATAPNVGATFNMPDNDKTLYAVWQINTHSVTYDIGAEATGTTPTQPDVDWNTSITTVDDSDFSRVGHTFGGWRNSVGGATVAVNTSLNIRSDVILTAVWNPIDYRVDFNENLQGSTLGDVTGFVPDSMTSVHYNAIVDVPANENSLSRTGHTLLGWDRNANATTPEFPLANASNNSFTMPAANVTLYAIWEIQEREVIFVNNHNATDNTEHSRESTDYGSTLTLPTPPSRTGYDFVGWFTARTGGIPFTASTVVREDTTVYARWQAHSHTITFAHDLAGGTGALPNTIPTYFDEVETVPGQGSMIRNGYTFVGWRDSISNSVLTENAPLTVSGNHVLTAVWSRDGRFAVIYNANWPSLGDQDGQVPTSAYGNDYYTGQTVTVLDNNTLEVTGHTFLGWSSDANATTPDYVDGNTFAMGTTHVTLYAVWQIQERTLTYSVGTGTGTPPASQTVNWSSPVTVSGQGGMSKEGHTFGGWTDADGNPVAEDAVLSLTDNMTLTAVWNINSYNVTYNANITGGAGAGAISGMPSPSTVSVVFNQSHNITAMPSRVGHTFAGWATSPTATASDVVTSITMVVGGVNLYAVWTPINYAITFDLNLQGSNLGTIGGAVPNAITGRNYTNVVTVPVNENSLTRTGHTLLGWSRNANAITATYVADDTFNMPAYDVTLYAVWERQTREVTFIRNHDTDDNTQATSVTVLYGASLDAIMPAELTRSGHDSLGWFDARTSGTAFTSSTVVTETTNIYAQWQIQDRTITFANHETAEFISGSLPAAITVDYGTVVSIPDVGITRRGYEFTVWTDADDNDFASGDDHQLHNNLELTANWNRLERFAVIYNANGGILGNLSGDTPAGGDDYLPGETVTVLGYNTLDRTGHTFLGWSTDNNATIAEFVEGETFAMLDANVTLYAVWQINQHEVTVRHNIFAWNAASASAVEYAYEVFTMYYGDAFEADTINIANHNFYADASDARIIAAMGDAAVEINLYYRQHAYAFELLYNGATATEVSLEVNSRFPATDYNTLTWEDFIALFQVDAVNLDAAGAIPAPALMSPNFHNVDFDGLTHDTPFVVTVEGNWYATGQSYSATVLVHIVDSIAPVITVENPVLEFGTDTPPASMEAIIDAFGITVHDTFDGYLTNYTVEFAGSHTFYNIDWENAVGERQYAVYINAADSSGNTALTEVAVIVIEAPEFDETLGLEITLQPVADTSLSIVNGMITVTQGAISGYLEIEAAATEGAVITYQWYGNDTAVAGATSARMYIPTDLAVGTHEFQVMVTATMNPSYSIMSNVIAVNVVAPSIPPTDGPSDEPTEEPDNNLPPTGGGGSESGGDNNDVENDNNNDTNVGGDTTNNDTNNQGETEGDDADEDPTPETTLPESPAPTTPTTSVVEAEAPVSEIATESAPLPLTATDNMIQYGDMWIELDDAGVPLGAWNWDEESEMWIFDENVPLGAFAAVGAGAVLGAASAMPQTGIESNTGMFAMLIALALIIATAAFVMIKRQRNKVK